MFLVTGARQLRIASRNSAPPAEEVYIDPDSCSPKVSDISLFGLKEMASLLELEDPALEPSER